MPTSRPPAVVLGLGAGLFVWLLHMAGLLASLDGLAYDAALRFAPPLPQPATVLLLQWDDQASVAQPDLYQRALSDLQALGARQVVFTFLPEAHASFYQQAVRQGALFGRPLIANPSKPDELELADFPAGAQGSSIPFGVVKLPPVTHAVARRQFTFLEVQGQRYPLLETAAAHQRLAGSAPWPADYGVRFRGGPGSLPHVSLKALLAGQLVPELVQGRTVLIGRPPAATAPGLCAPTTQGHPSLSLLEFHGQALDTLLQGRAIRTLPPGESLLLLLATTALGAAAYERLARGAWPLVLLAGGLAALLVLWYLDLWLPVVPLILAQLLCLAVLFRDQAARSSLAVHRLLLELSVGGRGQDPASNISQTPRHGNLLVRFLTQTLNLQRLLVLEAVPGQRQLIEVAALNSSFADVEQRRRDASGEPYTTALAARVAIPLGPSDRPLLPGLAADEQGYLTPLLHANQVIGFWLLGVASSQVDRGFLAAVEAHAGAIAERLFRRRQEPAGAGGTFLDRVLSWARAEESHQALARAVRRQQQRLIRSEKHFAESATPTVAYDLFGQVREVNTAMRTLLAQRGLGCDDLPLVDLLAALTGKDPDYARRCLRHVLLEKQRLMIAVLPAGDRHYALQLGPLRAAPFGPGEPTLADVTGVMCELVDRTVLVRLNQQKERLAERLGVLLRNDLAALDLSAALLVDPELGPVEREEIGTLLQDKVRQMVGTLAEAQLFATADVIAETAPRPVDGAESLREAVRAASSAGIRDVGFRISQPELINYVLAAPEQLGQTFASVLTFLARDARTGSQVHVQVEESEKAVHFAFTNEGFGIPPERFAELLSSPGLLVSEDFRELRTALDRARTWGTVQADSQVGTGTSITLCLPRFA